MRRTVTLERKVSVWKTVISCDVCDTKLDEREDDESSDRDIERLHIFASYGRSVPHSGDIDIFNDTFDICNSCVEKGLDKARKKLARHADGGRGEEVALILEALATLVRHKKPWERK